MLTVPKSADASIVHRIVTHTENHGTRAIWERSNPPSGAQEAQEASSCRNANAETNVRTA